MGIAANNGGLDVGAAMRLLGEATEHPVAALRYRNVLATLHTMDRDSGWDWAVQPEDGQELAAILMTATPLDVKAGGRGETSPAGTLVFLHPHRAARVTATDPATVMAAWVPWRALAEIESGANAPSEIIPVSVLGRGLQAFLASLLAQPVEPTQYTDYLVEQLITEMTFGVLLEAGSGIGSPARTTPDIERARSLMLVRRVDPDFGVATLAQEMHMSVRQVQRMFAAEGSTPTDELRRSRVALARELIADAGYAPLRISEIAVHSGFRDASNLRRAFLWAGLPSPRQLRKADP